MTTEDTVTVLVPSDTPMGTLKAVAADMGCVVRLRADGVFVFEPRHQPRDHAAIRGEGE